MEGRAREREGHNPQPHWQARKVLNSGGSGEDDVEVGLFRGPKLLGVAVEPERASRVAVSPSEVIFPQLQGVYLPSVLLPSSLLNRGTGSLGSNPRSNTS